MIFFRDSLYLLAIIAVLSGCNVKERRSDEIREMPSDPQSRIGAMFTSLDDAVKQSPGNPEIYYRRAALYLQAGKSADALRDARKAVEMDSLEPKYQHILARAYMAYGQPARALEIGHKSAAFTNNTGPEHSLLMAEAYLAAKEREKALLYVDKALEVAPYEEWGYLLKARIFEQQKDTTKALSLLKKAIKLNPEFAEAYNQLAYLYIRNKNYAQATALLNQGLRTNPEDGKLHYNMGLVYMNTDALDSARISFKKAAFYDPDLDMATYQLGMVSFEDKKYSEALGYFEGLIAQNKLLPESNYWSGQINSILGRRERAIAQFEKVVRFDSVYVREAHAALASLTYRAPERLEPAPVQAARPKATTRASFDMLEAQPVFRPTAPPKPKPITLDSIRK